MRCCDCFQSTTLPRCSFSAGSPNFFVTSETAHPGCGAHAPSAIPQSLIDRHFASTANLQQNQLWGTVLTMTRRILRVVVASPNDVQAERKRLVDMIDELNLSDARDNDVHLELWRWETDAYPGFHPLGPQGLIDSLLRIRRKWQARTGSTPNRGQA
jgi:hypothetical protein